MKNIKNYSVKFYHIFVVFLFVSLSFQWGFAQKPEQIINGKIKLYFETVEKTKDEMDAILANDSLIYLQVYAEFSPEFTAARLAGTTFDPSTFSWALCNELGTLASAPSKDVILLGHSANNCPQGSQEVRNRGSANYAFAQRGCPTFGHYATVGSYAAFGFYLKEGSTHIVKMSAIGFKLLSSDGFFVRMANDGKIDESSTSVVFNIIDEKGPVAWTNSKYDWGQAGDARFDISQPGGVVVKKGFKNKSV